MSGYKVILIPPSGMRIIVGKFNAMDDAQSEAFNFARGIFGSDTVVTNNGSMYYDRRTGAICFVYAGSEADLEYPIYATREDKKTLETYIDYLDLVSREDS